MTPTPQQTDHHITLEQVKNYYGEVLKQKEDLQTNACCDIDAMPRHLAEIIAQIDDEILEKFYGCGSPIPPAVEGCTVLDLGCGSGRDCYVISKLVGPSGRVIGVDMTDGQLAVARKHIDGQMQKFGFAQPNIEFKQGYIEDLAAAGIADNSVDVVVSNCVINLSPDKQRVFSEIFRVLKPGGELFFSDVFTDRRVPTHLQNDEVLRGECLGGALYIEDFRRMLRDLGCLDYRVLTSRRLTLESPEVEAKTGNIQFHSMTVRAFKLPDSIEDICEDYGQVATYQGGIANSEHAFTLDDHHVFEKGRPMLVCGNTAAMVQETRFGKYFQVSGDRSTHFGAFPCGDDSGSSAAPDAAPGGCC
jgi:ubiquinone/menaquinone biosynthesis C-methylase UbiE